MKENGIMIGGDKVNAIKSDRAGLNKFKNAEMGKSVDGGVKFGLGAGNFEDNRIGL